MRAASHISHAYQALALSARASIADDEGHLAIADSCHAAALEMHRSQGDADAVGVELGKQASALRRQGRYVAARDTLVQGGRACWPIWEARTGSNGTCMKR